MTIPLEEGFTVVTGPNGSGKSNILDGVLFCLGLANSKGMRADRLPDLVNSSLLKAGKSAETEVSVRFDLTDWKPDLAEEGLEPPSEGPWIKSGQKDWTVTRRLRVMPGGSYSSTYSSDGEVCNLQQLQTQLRRLRIDPEGSNVVMQGDVTRIVSMSNRDRRGLIDELAGVALFDRRIEQTRKKLDDVHERQERCRIVEQELCSSKHRLEKDCEKARIYKDLREKMHCGRQQELVLAFETAKKASDSLQVEFERLGQKEIKDLQRINELEKQLSVAAENLKNLQDNVKELGEDRLLAVKAKLAQIDTQSDELDRQAIDHKLEGEKLRKAREELLKRKDEIQLDNKSNQDECLTDSIEKAEKICTDALSAVNVTRRRLGDVADRSGACLDDQRKRNQLRQTLQESLSPLIEERQKLEERFANDSNRQKELQIDQERDKRQNEKVIAQIENYDTESKSLSLNITEQKKKIKELLDSFEVNQRTISRLESEKVRLEREIARLDSRRETLQESRGTGALRILLESGLEGIHGPVAQLAEVDEFHRLALEVAAGSRLGHIVVENDRIAAKAIDLLKIKKAGRLTFLPLNRIKSSSYSSNNALARLNKVDMDGCIGKAVDLLKFEPIYKNVFSYVFSETLVFDNLTSARNYLGKTRAVTLQGELLEKSGAMTGGSLLGRNYGFSFERNNDKDEAEPVKIRLLEIGETLVQCRKEENLITNRQEVESSILRKLEQRQAALEAERLTFKDSNLSLLERTQEADRRLKEIRISQANVHSRLEKITKEIIPLSLQLKDVDVKDSNSNAGTDAKNWQRLKTDLEEADSALVKARTERDALVNSQRQRELQKERLESQGKALMAEEMRLREAVELLAKSHKQRRDQQNDLDMQRQALEEQQTNLLANFGELRRERDEVELSVAKQRQELQESQWKLDRLRDDRTSLKEEIRSGLNRVQELERTLPKPLPEIPEQIRSAGLEQLQLDLQQLQGKMEALEPVNMLALEELQELEKRLEDLCERLKVLSEERSELLLRIETVATLRQEAFMEAFDEVDKHFREIFATLSDGDGHLQLDDKEDPLEGGLTLVAHPKGKPVRRLAAMSGGEKSLTALSFLFALQRFRPSPFYALDEVDSFLDGVNVERLSTLISTQSEQAQFLVVSHRRPMIAASGRTIGVTQARGSHTQVVGLPQAA